MKYIIAFLAFLILGLCGYWYGYRVGFEEGTILKDVDIALSNLKALSELRDNPDVDAKDLHEIQINKSLISYGEYMEKASPPLPGFYSVRPVLNGLVAPVVKYREGNPRVKDGIVYSPHNQEYEKTDEYKNLPIEIRQKFEKENIYFRNAMGFE